MSTNKNSLSFIIRPNRFFWFYVVLITLVLFLFLLMFVLINQIRDNNELLNFYPTEEIIFSASINPADDKLVDLTKKYIIQRGQDEGKVNDLFSLVNNSDKVNIVIIKTNIGEELVIASLSIISSNILPEEIKTLIYQERVSFLSVDQKLLDNINIYLNNHKTNPIRKSLIQKKLIRDYDFFIKTAFGGLPDQVYFYGNKKDKSYECRIVEEMTLWPLYFSDNDLENQLIDYSQSDQLAFAINNIDLEKISETEIDSNLNIIFEKLGDEPEIQMLKKNISDIWIFNNTEDSNLFKWIDKNTAIENFDIIVSFNISQRENLEKVLEQIIETRLPEIEQVKYSQGGVGDNYLAKDVAPDPLLDTIDDNPYYYYQANEKIIAYLPLKEKIYLAGSKAGINLILSLSSLNKDNLFQVFYKDSSIQLAANSEYLDFLNNFNNFQYYSINNSNKLNIFGKFTIK